MARSLWLLMSHTLSGAIVGRKQLVEPFLDCGLAVGPSDGHYRNVEIAAVVGGQILQCFKWRVYDEEIGVSHMANVVNAFIHRLV